MLATRFICARKSRHVDHRGEILPRSAAVTFTPMVWDHMLGAPGVRQSGWGRSGHSIQELARKHAPEAIEALDEITWTKRTLVPVSQPLMPCLTAPMAKHPRSAPPIPATFKRAIDMTDDELAAIASGATLHVVK